MVNLRKRATGIVSLVTAVILMTTVFGGCSSNKPGSSNSSGTQGSTDTSINQKTPGKVTYPISTDGSISLSWWLPLPSAAAKYIKSFDENEAFKEIQKNTGVDIKFIHPAQGQEAEQFNLTIASGDLPDIMYSTNYIGGAAAGVSDGVFLDISDKFKDFAPDYYKAVTTDELLYRVLSDQQSKLYSFALIKDRFPPYNRLAVRSDTLSGFGLDIPKTLNDYEKMFQKMLDSGITPVSISKDGYERQFMGMYDVLPGFYKDVNGKVAYGQIQPEFKKYLELMNSWYQKGYISKDFISLKSTDIQPLFDTKKIGIALVTTATAYNRAVALGYQISTFPYPRLTEGQQLHHEDTNVVNYETGFDAVITKNCKNVEAAMKLLNYLYTDKGAMLANFGVEGSAYNMVNGKLQYTEKVLKNPNIPDLAAINVILKIHQVPKLSAPDVECGPGLISYPDVLAARKQWSDDPKVDNKAVLPPITFSLDDSAKLSQIMKQVNTYSDEMTLKFITGAEKLSNFDNYVKTIKSFGIDQAIKINQDTYDKLMSKKLK